MPKCKHDFKILDTYKDKEVDATIFNEWVKLRKENKKKADMLLKTYKPTYHITVLCKKCLLLKEFKRKAK